MMVKQEAEEPAPRDTKRQKLQGAPANGIETITSARQLKLLLTFQQDASVQLRTGIKTFKSFLEFILYASDKASTVPQQSILKKYLESEIPRSVGEDEAPVLRDLMQAWSFAAQVNNDSLLSSVSAVLALLLKTISTLIEFRDLGIQLCRTLLQQSQLKLISRALAAPRQKEHVISPSLRLLIEVVTFDGGTLAKKVFAAKTFTFDGKILARNLSLWREASEDGEEDKRKPALRSNAVRYLLAHLKHQSSAVKSEIMKYGNVIRSLFEHLQHDPTDVLKEVLEAVKVYLLDDDMIPRSVKGYVLNERNLFSLATLLRRDSSLEDVFISRQNIVKDFLSHACTEPRAGLLRQFAGWYPPGTERGIEDVSRDDDMAEIDLGLDSVEWYNKYTRQIPVRNVTLANFSQTLRPFANTAESELLLRIFTAAPELVTDYFFKKSEFAFDPKLTATWIGYASLLFSTLALPVPEYFGRKESYCTVPPPVSIVLENVLPQPLSQKVLTRCLNQSIELITFFAVRILVVTLQKLDQILSRFRDASQLEGSLWEEGAERLKASFSQRCPKIKDVISTYRKTSRDNYLQREAILRLLELYYRVAPEIAAEDKFDVSITLAEELKEFEQRSSEPTDESVDQRIEQLRLLNLRHMLEISAHSSDMRWTHKPEALQFSPLMTLLKLLATLKSGTASKQMWDLASSILQDEGLVQQQTAVPAVYALIATLKPSSNWAPSDPVFTFLDDVLARTVRKPIKYEDDLQEVAGSDEAVFSTVSPIHMTLVEQWTFAATRPEQAEPVAEWLGRYCVASKAIGEDAPTLDKIIAKLSASAKDEAQRASLLLVKEDDIRETLSGITLSHTYDRKTSDATSDSDATLPLQPNVDPYSFAPLPTDSKANGLHRWSSKDIPSAISDGDFSLLILCLTSSFPEVRAQALSNLRNFLSRLDALRPTYPDTPQFYLLAGILLNTATPLMQATSSTSDAPFPSFLPVYAALASRILQQPLHPLYDALNRFHTRSPKWDPERLASYWTHTILYTPCTASTGLSLSSIHKHAPTTTNATSLSLGEESSPATFEEALQSAPIETPVQFLLSLVYHSLRTRADLGILRKRGTLEPLLAMAGADEGGRREAREGVLRVLWRITCIDGGGDVLIRKGVVAWVGCLIAGGEGKVSGGRKQGEGGREVLCGERGLKMLVRRIWDTSDREWAERWSGGVLGKMVAKVIEGL